MTKTRKTINGDKTRQKVAQILKEPRRNETHGEWENGEATVLVQSLQKFAWQVEAVQVRDLPFHKGKLRYFRIWNVGNFLSVAELVAGNTFNGLHIVRKSRLVIRYCYADSAHPYISRKKEILEMGQEKENQEREKP